ncbi:hypothetical protein NDN01_03695 [Sphingomonas sp. QA11]|uniref:hypothetical protein n=1 Tax=Sphingomonas sp. QA11 TaxID=2950605 RepID=UPI00234B0A7F|nr:hypothetical protein [Sphingomonas sp. QA11]WCM28042.1 hypothetical protein NDN01_03695 [Sphingomonas sp. QA11]
MLVLVTKDAKPNLNQLAVAAKNIRILELNVKAFGYEMARRLSEALPIPDDTAPRIVALASKPCVQADLESDWAAHWARELRCPVLYHRKLWEYLYVLQAIYEHGHIRPGVRGLGFGCGAEPLPSYLASKAVAVTATDQSLEIAKATGWASSNQHLGTAAGAHQPHLVPQRVFEQFVSFRTVDMNAIPGDLVGYDFCWSICALEHLGSIEKGLAFIEASLATLRPRGLAVHTLEFNIEADGPTIDNWPTVLFQRKHIERLTEKLTREGHEVAALSFDCGAAPMDRFVDLPPWSHDLPVDHAYPLGEPRHLKLAIDGFIATSFGLIIRKRA